MFVWALAVSSGTTSIAVTATVIVRGNVRAATKVKLQMQGGQVESVDALFGFSF
jgi:hypothetical protein